MDLTAGTRATAIAGTLVLAGGVSIILYGILRNDLARALGGACLAMTALTLVALIAIRRWVTDTSDERRVLAAAQRHAEGERSRYFAAQAALENEQGRLNRDMAAERAALTTRLMAEREAVAAEFEERRAALIAETMEATVLMIHNNKLAPETPTKSKVIQLREHQQQRHPERERERERGHGVVGP